MPLPVLADRVAETTVSEGAGNLVLQGAVVGHRRFYDIASVGAQVYYVIEGPSGQWETGIGTLTAASELRRDTVLASSNSNTLVYFLAGSKTVFIDVPAMRIAAAGSFLFTQSTPAAIWTVDHNLGKYPAAEVMDANGRKVYADIVHVSLNRLQIFCSPALAGQVCLS